MKKVLSGDKVLNFFQLKIIINAGWVLPLLAILCCFSQPPPFFLSQLPRQHFLCPEASVRDRRVIVLGLGPVGSEAAKNLLLSGVGNLVLCDDRLVRDISTEHNWLLAGMAPKLKKGRSVEDSKSVAAVSSEKLQYLAQSSQLNHVSSIQVWSKSDLLSKLRDDDVVFICVDKGALAADSMKETEAIVRSKTASAVVVAGACADIAFGWVAFRENVLSYVDILPSAIANQTAKVLNVQKTLESSTLSCRVSESMCPGRVTLLVDGVSFAARIEDSQRDPESARVLLHMGNSFNADEVVKRFDAVQKASPNNVRCHIVRDRVREEVSFKPAKLQPDWVELALRDSTKEDQELLASAATATSSAGRASWEVLKILSKRFEPHRDGVWRFRVGHKRDLNEDCNDNSGCILVIGAGAIACEVLKCLCLLRMKKIIVVDFDTVSASNLHRQSLFTKLDAVQGRYKSEAAVDRLCEMGLARNARDNGCEHEHLTSLRSCTTRFRLDAKNPLRFLEEVEPNITAVVGCVDNEQTRLEIELFAHMVNIPYVDSGTGFACAFKAQTIIPGQSSLLRDRVGRSIWPLPEATRNACLGVTVIRTREDCMHVARQIYDWLTTDDANPPDVLRGDHETFRQRFRRAPATPAEALRTAEEAFQALFVVPLKEWRKHCHCAHLDDDDDGNLRQRFLDATVAVLSNISGRQFDKDSSRCVEMVFAISCVLCHAFRLPLLPDDIEGRIELVRVVDSWNDAIITTSATVAGIVSAMIAEVSCSGRNGRVTGAAYAHATENGEIWNAVDLNVPTEKFYAQGSFQDFFLWLTSLQHENSRSCSIKFLVCGGMLEFNPPRTAALIRKDKTWLQRSFNWAVSLFRDTEITYDFCACKHLIGQLPVLVLAPIDENDPLHAFDNCRVFYITRE